MLSYENWFNMALLRCSVELISMILLGKLLYFLTVFEKKLCWQTMFNSFILFIYDNQMPRSNGHKINLFGCLVWWCLFYSCKLLLLSIVLN